MTFKPTCHKSRSKGPILNVYNLIRLIHKTMKLRNKIHGTIISTDVVHDSASPEEYRFFLPESLQDGTLILSISKAASGLLT